MLAGAFLNVACRVKEPETIEKMRWAVNIAQKTATSRRRLMMVAIKLLTIG
jgi:hypothetical protein